MADVYEVLGYGGTASFVRDDKGIVSKVILLVSGANMEGVRQIAKLDDYVGKFTFENAPFASLVFSVEGSDFMVDAEGIGKGGLERTSNLDEFYQKDYNATITFVRDATQAIVSVNVAAQGGLMEGKKAK